MKMILLLVLIGCLLIGGYIGYATYSDYRNGWLRQAIDRKRAEEHEKQLTMAKRRAAWAHLKQSLRSQLSSYKVEVGMVIKDLDMNWQIDCNKDAPLPSASLVKIPIMLAYEYAAKDGRISLSDKVELKNYNKAEGSGVLKTFQAGSVFSVEALIYLMITQSDNTAANMLIDLLGADTLNRYFAKMGLKRTNLSRRMMDFKARKNGVENYTTASDMAYLLEKVYRGKLISVPVSKKCLRLLASQKINDRIPKKLPQNTVVAHKTGLENGICHDVGIVYTNKGNFLVCVLTRHQYKHARYTKRLIQDISLATYNYYGSF
jgi:beta-lactamase class A